MQTDTAIQALVKAGAAVRMRTDPTPILVTWWRRVNAGRHFYFTTGDDTFAGHRIDFDREEVIYGGDAVAFYTKDGALVAYLAPLIEQKDDPEWEKTSLDVIAAWRAHYDATQSFRAFVLEEYHSAGEWSR